VLQIRLWSEREPPEGLAFFRHTEERIANLLQVLAFVDDLRAKHKLGSQFILVNENLIALFLGRGKTQLEPQDFISRSSASICLRSV